MEEYYTNSADLGDDYYDVDPADFPGGHEFVTGYSVRFSGVFSQPFEFSGKPTDAQ